MRTPVTTFFVVEGKRLEVPCGEYLIGRSRRCAIRLDDPYVSRTQLRCRIDADLATVEDLGGKNAVHLNGRPLVGVSCLADGDEILVGSTSIKVHLEPVGRREEFDEEDTITLTNNGVSVPRLVVSCPACRSTVDHEDDSCPRCGYRLRRALTHTQELPKLK